MIVVVGSGGNGQTYFMEFLKINNVSINDTTDKDGLKHLSTPEKLKQKNRQLIQNIFLLGSLQEYRQINMNADQHFFQEDLRLPYQQKELNEQVYPEVYQLLKFFFVGAKSM